MSKTADWVNRITNYRYSQDDRVLAYRFAQEQEPKLLAFETSAEKTMSVGPYNIDSEPWKVMTLKELARKFAFKLTEQIDENGNVTFMFSKQKLSRQRMG